MTALTTPIIFSDLRSGYGTHDVLAGLTGTIEPAKITALIGPNGSGKTTLLKTLAGLLPYTGSVTLDGRELKSYSRRSLGRLLGMVPQQPSVKAAFTVYDVISFGRLPWQPLLSAPSPHDDELVQAAAAHMELTSMLFRPVTQLSGGERQRVFLAMVIAQDAPVFLLDEPTSAMDPRQGLLAFGLLKKLTALGKTVIVIAHNINAALVTADAYLGLKNGRLVSSGSASDIGADVLETLYDTPFRPYFSSKGDKVWHPCSENL